MPLLTGHRREHHGQALRSAQRLADVAQLVPRLDARTFTFANLGQAYDAVENRTATGKVVIEVAPEPQSPSRKEQS